MHTYTYVYIYIYIYLPSITWTLKVGTLIRWTLKMGLKMGTLKYTVVHL